MDNTHIALKKILKMMVPKKFPMVLNINVIDDSYEYDNIEKYVIYLGISYSSLEGTITSDIRDYVRDVSSYVLKGNETLRIMFSNSDLS